MSLCYSLLVSCVCCLVCGYVLDWLWIVVCGDLGGCVLLATFVGCCFVYFCVCVLVLRWCFCGFRGCYWYAVFGKLRWFVLQLIVLI